MKGVTASIRIAAPPADVFTRATNLAEWANTIDAITKVEVLTDGDDGLALGTRFRETRVMFGKEASEEMEVTEFNPPDGYTTEAESCGNHYVTRHTFEATDDGGTNLTISFQGQPITFLAKVMGVLLTPLMSGMLTKCLAADLNDLKQAVEKEKAA